MSFRRSTMLLFCCFWVTTVAGILQAVDKPIELGSRRELMLDDYLFKSLSKLSFKMHSPRVAEKAIAFDAPWEGLKKFGISVAGYSTMIQDKDRFRLYYASYFGLRLKPVDIVKQFTCYCESTDGIVWKRVNLNRVLFEGSRNNNIMRMGAMTSHNFAPFIDTRPGVPASQRYKAVGGNGKAYVFASADGLDWRKMKKEPILDGEEKEFDKLGAIRWGNNPGKERAILDSLNVPFWDPQRKHYALYFRAYLPALARAGKQKKGIMRSVLRVTSKDFLNWSKITPIRFGETRRHWKHELYTTMLKPYPRAPHILIGTPLRTVPRRPLRGGSFGLSETALMFSRDGLNFKLFDDPFMAPGRDIRNWSKHGNMTAWGMLQTAPDELSIYFQQHDHQKTAHLRRGVLRTDGFVSLHAGVFPGGTAFTKPLTFKGSRLELNAATSAAGSIYVSIFDAKSGNLIPGFERSREFFGDQIRHTVHWGKRSDISKLAGRPIFLRLRMFHADLYSLRFK